MTISMLLITIRNIPIYSWIDKISPNSIKERIITNGILPLDNTENTPLGNSACAWKLQYRDIAHIIPKIII